MIIDKNRVLWRIFPDNFTDIFCFIAISRDDDFIYECINASYMRFYFLEFFISSRQDNACNIRIFLETFQKRYCVRKELISKSCLSEKYFWIFYPVFFQKLRICDDVIRSSAIFLVYFRCFFYVRKCLSTKNIPFTKRSISVTKSIVEIKDKEEHINYTILIPSSKYTS